MNTWRGALCGSFGIGALVAIGVWHADDPEMQPFRPLAFIDAATVTTPLPHLTANRVYWSADGSRILSISRGKVDAFGRLALHDTAETNGCTPLDVASEAINCAALAPDGLHVLLGTGCGQLIWMGLQASEPITLLELPAHSVFSATAIADDGRRVAGATDTGTIYLSEPDGQNAMILTPNQKSSVAEMRFSPDGSHILSAQLDGRVTVWDLATGKTAQEFAGHAHAATAAAFLPDGKRIISGGLDDTIRIWDRATGRELWRNEFGLVGVKAMAVSPDGATAACGGFTRKIILWDLQRGQKKLDIATPASVIFHLSFSPDGASLAAAGTDATIRLYDAQTGIGRKGIEIDQSPALPRERGEGRIAR
jgi:WD40 repeat protein